VHNEALFLELHGGRELPGTFSALSSRWEEEHERAFSVPEKEVQSFGRFLLEHRGLELVELGLGDAESGHDPAINILDLVSHG